MRLHAEALLLAATIVCCGGSGLRTPSSGAPRSDNAAADVDATEIRGEDAPRTDAGDAVPEAVQSEVVDAPDAQAPPRDIPDDPGSDGMEPGEPEVPRTDADIAGSDAPFPGDRMEDAGPLTAARCFADQLPPSGVPPIDYDQFHPVIGSHCKGTNHQDIQGVQRVVFAGDSITTGTPPTPTANWYRNMLAKTLAAKFGLKAPGLLWQNVDLFGSGVTLEMHSGDFWSCAKFGARTDDLTREPHKQLITCNPPEERAKTTLIIMTVGGNDVFAWAQDLVDGVPIETLWLDAEKAVKDLEDAIRWVKDDPATFPNGVYVVFANTYEFSDADSGKDLMDATKRCPRTMRADRALEVRPVRLPGASQAPRRVPGRPAPSRDSTGRGPRAGPRCTRSDARRGPAVARRRRFRRAAGSRSCGRAIRPARPGRRRGCPARAPGSASLPPSAVSRHAAPRGTDSLQAETLAARSCAASGQPGRGAQPQTAETPR